MLEDSPTIPTPEAGNGATTAANPGANPAALTVAQLARLLGVTEDKVREHISGGAPAAGDGTVNLVRYVAWLNQRLKERDGPEV